VASIASVYVDVLPTTASVESVLRGGERNLFALGVIG
jgi:hypothetical protein